MGGEGGRVLVGGWRRWAGLSWWAALSWWVEFSWWGLVGG